MRVSGRHIDGAALNTADLNAIVEDIETLKKSIGSLMQHVKTGASDTVNGEARRIYGSLAAQGERSTAAIVRQVEERPFASLMIAFAIGFIGSRMLPR